MFSTDVTVGAVSSAGLHQSLHELCLLWRVRWNDCVWFARSEESNPATRTAIYSSIGVMGFYNSSVFYKAATFTAQMDVNFIISCQRKRERENVEGAKRIRIWPFSFHDCSDAVKHVFSFIPDAMTRLRLTALWSSWKMRSCESWE